MEDEVLNNTSVEEESPAATTEVSSERPDYEAEILDIIRGNSSPRLILSKIEDYHANDIAGVFGVLNAQERKKLYRISNPEIMLNAATMVIRTRMARTLKSIRSSQSKSWG